MNPAQTLAQWQRGIRGVNPLDSAAAFSVARLPGLRLWLDASDGATITSAANAVSQWNDKSGNGFHATQGTGAQQPQTGTRTMNSRNTIAFNGTSHNLILPAGLYGLSAGPSTVLIAFAADLTGGATQRIINGQDAGSGRYYAGINATGFTMQNNATGSAATETWTKVTTPSIGVIRRNGTAQLADINGGSGFANSGGADVTMTQFLIGAQTSASNWFAGIIGEIIMCNTALSNDTINVVARYLTRWGGTWAPR